MSIHTSRAMQKESPLPPPSQTQPTQLASPVRKAELAPPSVGGRGRRKRTEDATDVQAELSLTPAASPDGEVPEKLAAAFDTAPSEASTQVLLATEASTQELQIAAAEPMRLEGGQTPAPSALPAVPPQAPPWLAAAWSSSQLPLALAGGLIAALGLRDGSSGPAPDTSTASTPDPSQSLATVQGTITLGPALSGHTLTVSAYDRSGQLLAQAPLNADGSYTLNITNGYTGPVLLRVTDSGEGPDYVDEATGEERDLDSELRSVAVLDASGSATAHVTPLTELVLRMLGLPAGQSGAEGITLGNISAEQITEVKTKLAQALGLDGIDLTTARPDPIIDADGRIDLSRANAYGRLLAALSGMEAGEGHSTDQMLQTLLASIDLQTGTLSPDGLMDLVSGARLVAKKHPAADALFGEVGQAMGLSAVQLDGIDSAWRTLLTLADGVDNDGAGLSTVQLQALGVRRVEGGAKLDALNNVLDVKTSTVVQSRTKLQAWADTITVVLSKAAGGEATPTQDELEDLGLTDLTPGRTIDLVNKIAASPDEGSDVDSLAELQALVDVVAPTTSLSALTLGSDTGLSASDWITRQALQTLTASLSAPLLPDEQLLGSVDGGAAWHNISGFVNGTTLIWTGATLVGASTLKLKVIDAALNEGPVTERAYVLDTLVPNLQITQTNAQIAGDGLINAAERTAGIALSGTTEASRSVSIATGTGVDMTTTADDTGAWSASVPSANLATSGNVTFTVTSSDAAGNATAVSRTAAVDVAAPNLVVTQANNQIAGNGIINADERTAGIALSGTTEASRSVSIATGTGVDMTTTADDTGAWSASVPSANLATSGNVTFTVTSSDAAGNAAIVIRIALVDNTAPALIVTQADEQIAGDGIINAAERSAGVVLSGTTEAGCSVIIATGIGADVTATADEAGAWSAFVPSANLPNSGDVTFTVTSSDAAGNAATLTRTVAVDVTAPNLVVTQANNQIAGDGIINATERTAGITFSGITEAGRSVSIATGTGVDLTATADDTGAWIATVPSANLPTAGSMTVTVTSSDAAGNTATTTRTATVDVIAPSPPALTNPTHTNAARPLLVGTAEPGSSIVLTAANASFSAITGGDGLWQVDTATAQITFNLGADGFKAVQITSTDIAGNSTNSSTSFTLDTRAPEAELRLAPHVTLELPIEGYAMPRILGLPEDQFLVCWGGEEGRSIFAQRFTAGGTPFQDTVAFTDPLGNTFENLDLVSLGAGKGVAVSWLSVSQSNWQPYVQVINELGEATSTPVHLTITGAGVAGAPSLTAVGPGSEFVVVWNAFFPEVGLGSNQVLLQRFSLDDSGEVIAGDPAILERHSDARGPQVDPQIANLGIDGSFVVVWRASDEEDFSLVAQRFNPTGGAWGGPLFIEPDSVTHLNEGNHRIAALGTDGAFVLVYESYDMYGDGPSQSFMTHVDSDGEVSNATPLLAPGMDGVNAESPVVSALDDDSFIVAWVLGQEDEHAQQVCVQHFSVGQAGITAGTIHKLPALSTDSRVEDLQVTPWGDGFALSWNAWDGEKDRVLLQLFDNAGLPVGGAHQLRDPSTLGAYYPQMATLTDGSLALSWVSWFDQGAGLERVSAQHLGADRQLGAGVSYDSSSTEGVNGTTWLGLDDTVDIALSFNETVEVRGLPRLLLHMADKAVWASYLSGHGTTDLVFRYTVQAGEDAPGGIMLGELDLNDGAITDAAGNDAVLPNTGALQLNSGYRVDTQVPTAWAGVQDPVMVRLGEEIPFAGAAKILASVDDMLLMSLMIESPDAPPQTAFVALDPQGNLELGFSVGPNSESMVAEMMLAYDAWLDTASLVLNTGQPAEENPTYLSTVWLESDEASSTVFLHIVPSSEPFPIATLAAADGWLSEPQIEKVGDEGIFVVSWTQTLLAPADSLLDNSRAVFSLRLDLNDLIGIIHTQGEPVLPPANSVAAGSPPDGLSIEGFPDLSVDLVRVVAVGEQGAFALAWVGADDVANGADDSLYLQRFDSDGAPQDAPLRLEPPGVTDGTDGAAQVLGLGRDGFAVAWTGENAQGTISVFVQHFPVTGDPGAITEISPALPVVDWIRPLPVQMVALGNGSYVIGWVGQIQDGVSGVFVQRFTSSGVAIGNPQQLQSPQSSGGVDLLPKIAALGTDGAFVVAWSDSETNIYIQQVGAEGSMAGPVNRLALPYDVGMNTFNSNLQITALGDDGSYAVSWTARMNWGEGLSPGAVFVQRFNPDGSTSQDVTVEVGDDVRVSSSEPGKAYLVAADLVSNFEDDRLGVLTEEESAQWNTVAINAGYRSTELSTEGLIPGDYRLYTQDESGQWSPRSEHKVTVSPNLTRPEVWPDGGSQYATDQVWFVSSEKGTAYLIHSQLTDGLGTPEDLTSLIAQADPRLWNSAAVTRDDWETVMPVAGLRTGVYKLYALDRGGLLSMASEETVTVVLSPLQLSSVDGPLGFQVLGASVGDTSGTAVASAGDFNGDGFDDLLMGSPAGSPIGLAHIVFGVTAGLNVNLTADTFGGWTLIGESADGETGLSLAAAGDVNGDGLADVLIGAPGAASNAGRSYVVFGRTGSGTIDLANLGSGGFVIHGETAGDRSGWGVGGGGDVNGDGLSDLIVGAPRVPQDGVRGNSYVVYGRSDTTAVELSPTMNASQGFVIRGLDNGDFAGRSVAVAGDVNGDGLADVIAGAPFSDAGGGDVGGAVVVFGSTSGAAVDATSLGSQGFVIKGSSAAPISGESVAGVGDVNGDGLADLGVGVWGSSEGENRVASEGYVVFGQTGTTDVNLGSLEMPGLVIRARTNSAQFASNMRIAPAGDLNGDGLADVIVGTRLANEGRGISYVVFGQSQSGIVALDDVAHGWGGFAILGEIAGDQSGSSVHAAGDVDGDGLADLIVGAPGVDAGRGSSYVIFGTAADQFSETSVDQLGGSASDVFNDSGSAKTLVGGIGNDSLTATAASVLYGGAGDDLFVIGPAMIEALQSRMGSRGNVHQLARIDGGSGIDTLALSGTDDVLDLTMVANPGAGDPHGASRLSGIEIIDLTGLGNNTLRLGATDVLDLVGFNGFEDNGRRQLLVKGNAGDPGLSGDRVELVDDGWIPDDTATIDGDIYDVWDHATSLATLYVSQGVAFSQSISVIVLPPLIEA